ncbi:MAG: hypothetical protein A2073_07980 [Deltaproteobacteria bacterium GWC2_42_11]|nr:MAG: hypothetical protein A2073_07980 [Deltaproteobacteria bacterium GWC2_42_11]HBO85305.1 efflux RND transporter periplasmic adaptor subunit [Deltaproteobacteria bacterium]
MRKILLGLIISFLGLAVVGAGIWWYVNKSGVKSQESGVEAKKERKILFYRHPMNPSITSPTSQKDEMGMDYIPVYKEETEQDEVIGTVKLTPEKIQKIGVKIEEAKVRTLTRTIRTVGRVEHDESRVFNINTKVGGWIEKLYVNKTDLMVHPGGKLIELYSPELVAAQEEYILAVRAMEKGKENGSMNFLKDAVVERLKYWDISDNEIEKLKNEKKVRRTIIIYAPVHGIVTEKMVNQGQKVEAGETLFKIIDHSSVWVYGEVYEYELPFIKMGQKANIIPSYTPQDVYTARISHIYSHFGTVRHETENGMEESRTAKIRFDLPNPGHKLKLGMYVNIELKVDVASNAVSVPESAVIDTGVRQAVIIDKGDGRFEPRDIKVGAQADGYYQIISGVNAGERVVTSANFLIDSESNLKAALSGMTSHQHGGEKK